MASKLCCCCFCSLFHLHQQPGAEVCLSAKASAFLALRVHLQHNSWFIYITMYLSYTPHHTISVSAFNISFCSSATLCCKRKGHEVHQSMSVFRYHQAGTPKLEVSTSYDSSEHTYTIRTKQSTPTPAGQPAKLPVMLPLAVALFDKSGHELPLKLKVCMLAMLMS